MSISHSKSATLNIAAADDATEIFLINASMRRIASGLGRLQVNVKPGIYKVRFRSGASQHDKLVEVSSPGEHVDVEGPPVLFRTAAPIYETLTTHEYQSGPAEAISKGDTHCVIGSGGELFLFIREEDEEKNFSLSGLTVHSLDGTELANIEEGELNIQSRWSALSIRVDPGTYSVRVPSGGIGVYEIFVTVSHGWQTQVFMVMDEFWHERKPFRAPSLRSASVLMSHLGHGFDPYSRNVRLAELARQALEQGRNVISSQLMNELLSEKFGNPILGIIAAHLIVSRRRPNLDTLRIVIDNLFNMLGEHPDVLALSIAMKSRYETYHFDSIDNPPLLRKSWDLVTKASRQRANLVQLDSPFARIANEVVTGGPWLIHRINDEYQSYSNMVPSLAESKRILEELLSIEPDNVYQIIEQVQSSEQQYSGLERSILGAVTSFIQAHDMETEEMKSSQRLSARRVLSDVSAPSYSIANAVMGLANKIKVK